MNQPIHLRSRLAIVDAQNRCEAGLAFNQRGDIGIALRTREDHQITLPIAKLAAVIEFFEAFCDLLGRPTVFQPINDGSRKFAGLGAIAALDVTLISQHLRGPMPVAVSLRNIVVVSPVTVYLAVDRRTVSS